MKISKDFKFDCCHLLSNYEGKCANLHGHTYHGTVTIAGKTRLDTGMLVDYNVIKEVVDRFDHAVIFSCMEARNNAEETLFDWAEEHNMKYVEMPVGHPKSTAECLALYIRDLLDSDIRVPAGSIVSVKLSETDGSWAEV